MKKLMKVMAVVLALVLALSIAPTAFMEDEIISGAQNEAVEVITEEEAEEIVEEAEEIVEEIEEVVEEIEKVEEIVEEIEEIVEEIEKIEEIVEEAPVAVERSVRVSILKDYEDICIDDVIVLCATLKGFDNVSYSMQWQISTDGGISWQDVRGAVSDTLTVTVTEANAGCMWRLAVNAD